MLQFYQSPEVLLSVYQAYLLNPYKILPWRRAWQPSCLENRLDRGAWWATHHGVTKSRTQLKQLSTHAQNP